MNPAIKIIEPRAKDLGDGLTVRRSLPHPTRQMVGPFIFWDHMGPVPLTPQFSFKVRSHPHIGLATMTYLFSGEIMHRDSLGNKQVIRPGEVNWMTAGDGIVHSERHHPSTHQKFEGIQLWLALPDGSEDVPPSFVHIKESDLPLIEKNGAVLRLIAGEAFNKKSPIKIFSPLFYLAGSLNLGAELAMPISGDNEGAIYLVSGEIRIEEQNFTKPTVIIYPKGQDLRVKALRPSQIMIFGGEPFTTPRHIWWNFVSSSKENIEAAKKRWQEKRFPPVPEETEFIPLPED